MISKEGLDHIKELSKKLHKDGQFYTANCLHALIVSYEAYIRENRELHDHLAKMHTLYHDKYER